MMVALIILPAVLLPPILGANCGTPLCGSPTPASNVHQPLYLLPQYNRYQQMPSYYQAQPSALRYQYYYYPVDAYQIPPYTIQNVHSSIDKGGSTPTTTTQPTTYDYFEKELDKLRPGAAREEKSDEKKMTDELNGTVSSQSITYIRGFNGLSPSAYTSQPLPYRPVPYVTMPAIGCQQLVIPKQPSYSRTPEVLPLTSTYVTAPSVVPRQQQLSILPTPINDCCGKCGAPCKFRSKKHVIALASKIFTAQFVPRRDVDNEDEPKDPKCNSEQLKDVMSKFITRTVALSKRLIQKNAESELGGYFSVICSTEDFSYVTRSETFCQLQKHEIVCYAFKHM